MIKKIISDGQTGVGDIWICWKKVRQEQAVIGDPINNKNKGGKL
jgi:hypothetical protein